MAHYFSFKMRARRRDRRYDEERERHGDVAIERERYASACQPAPARRVTREAKPRPQKKMRYFPPHFAIFLRGKNFYAGCVSCVSSIAADMASQMHQLQAAFKKWEVEQDCEAYVVCEAAQTAKHEENGELAVVVYNIMQ